VSKTPDGGVDKGLGLMDNLAGKNLHNLKNPLS